jgi:homoserine kinase
MNKTPSNGRKVVESVTVRVPASTSNCGPGFDTLSVALSLYNFVQVERRPDGQVEVLGDLSDRDGATAMTAELLEAFATAAGLRSIPGCAFQIWGDVPMARGLGSSATVRAGLMAGINRLCGDLLTEEAMIRVVATLENAPDNATAVFRGGFCVSRMDPESGEYADSLSFPVADSLSFVVVSPDIHVLTRTAREVLPGKIAFREAVRTVNSAAYLTAVMIAGSYERLGGAVEDFLHEPYRQPLCACVREVIAAGCESGAYCGWISGSGSSLLCVAPTDRSAAVGQAMAKVYGNAGIAAQLFTLVADNDGLCFV